MNNAYKIVLMILISTVWVGSAPCLSFWDISQEVESQNYDIEDMCFDGNCRVHDNNVEKDTFGLERAGVDIWMAYIADDDVFVKNYRFSNKYSRYDNWLPTVNVTNSVSSQYQGLSIESVYYNSGGISKGLDSEESGNTGRGLPAAYVSFLSQSNATSTIQVVRVNHALEVTLFPSLVVSNTDSLSQSKILKCGTDFLVFWDEQGASPDTRNLNCIKYTRKEIVQPDGSISVDFIQGTAETIVSGITATDSLEFQVEKYSYEYNRRPRFEQSVRGIITWCTSGTISSVQGIGFDYSTPDGFNCAANVSTIADGLNTNLFTRPRIAIEPAHLTQNDDVTSSITWKYQTEQNNYIQLRNVKFDTTETGWLELRNNIETLMEVDSDYSIYEMTSDDGFMRPVNVDYDDENSTISMTQMANHRLNFFDDPMEGSPGCWIAEYYNLDTLNTGSLTRIAESPIEIRNLGWVLEYNPVANPDTVEFHGYSFPDEINGNIIPLREETLDVANLDSIKQIIMIKDAFSSFYCFILTRNSVTGVNKIFWVCDGLLYRDSNHRDRFNRPFDLEFIPPTPTFTPIPPNLNITPLPTPTPPPASVWVADMTGHRIVRVNDRGHVEAETHTIDLTEYTPVWSEYEQFDVISPNDVSAAYDGTCWAIDWGRNRVVKVNVDGSIAAVTEPCDRPDPEYCLNQLLLIHPVSIDCGGQPDTCFVADYEANKVFKLSLDGNGDITIEASQAEYNRPKAIAVDSYYDVNGHLIENIWVADRWSNEPTPAHSWTFTPVPTRTPTPGPGTPQATPNTATPYPEHQRVSMNQFSEDEIEYYISCSIPLGLSVISNSYNGSYCYIADRDAGWSQKTGESQFWNFIRRIELGNGTYEELHFGENDNLHISRPMDVAPVNPPPTPTPTPSPTSTIAI